VGGTVGTPSVSAPFIALLAIVLAVLTMQRLKRRRSES